MKAKVLIDMSVKELREELHSLYRELFSLRMQKGMEGSVKPHLFIKARRDIARIKTVMKKKEAEVK